MIVILTLINKTSSKHKAHCKCKNFFSSQLYKIGKSSWRRKYLSFRSVPCGSGMVSTQVYCTEHAHRHTMHRCTTHDVRADIPCTDVPHTACAQTYRVHCDYNPSTHGQQMDVHILHFIPLLLHFLLSSTRYFWDLN